MQPSPDNSPFADAQKVALDIGRKLDQILQAILPLHDLLQAQEKAEQGLTQRLTELLESFSSIATHLEAAAEALTKLSEAEELPRAEEEAFKWLGQRLEAQDAWIQTLHHDLRTMMEWLSTPADQPPARM